MQDLSSCEGFAESWLLCGLFSSCGKRELLSCCGAQACCGFSLQTAGSRHVGSVVVMHGLRCSRLEGSSWTRDLTCVSCMVEDF